MTTHTPEGLREAAKKAGCRIVYDGVRHFISYAPRGWILNECHSTEEDAWQACERYVAKDPAILAALPPNSREQEGVDRIAVAFAVANGFTEGNEHYLEASPAQRQRYDFVVDALIEEGLVSAPAPAGPTKGSGELENRAMPGHPDAYLTALLRYTKEFYAWAIELGAKPGAAADAVQHVERAARGLHALTLTAYQPAALSRRTGSEVPQGWKLVPVEPTEAMLQAGARAFGSSAKYAAMIAAAPPPEGRG